MRKKLRILHSLICQPNLRDGINETGIPYIKIHKGQPGNVIFPVWPETFIYYIDAGTISIHDEIGITIFSQGDFYVPKPYRPASAIACNNFTAIIAAFCMNDIVEIFIETDGSFRNSWQNNSTQSTYSEKIVDALIRVFEYSDNKFMLKNIKKELLYHIMSSPYGRIFIKNALAIQDSSEIFTINHWIRENYKNSFSVEDLALQANMSISNFHQKFKASVGMGPIQCQKQLRLVEARRLLFDKSVNVTSAALEVGYGSISQFIADYRRMFGCPPQKDIQAIRKRLIIQTNS